MFIYYERQTSLWLYFLSAIYTVVEKASNKEARVPFKELGRLLGNHISLFRIEAIKRGEHIHPIGSEVFYPQFWFKMEGVKLVTQARDGCVPTLQWQV